MELDPKIITSEGERILDSEPPQLVLPHLNRYQFATSFLRPGDRVLDCACGTGYGSDLLADWGADVTGMDISDVALNYCRSRYRRGNLTFQKGSAEELPFPGEYFDAFISFETIEHIPHPDRLVSEALRVLKPHGKFLVSTPNRVASGLVAGQKPGNPFHLFEWSLAEFDVALKREFHNIRYFGQRIRSTTKFHPKYIASKVQRWMGKLDIIEFDATTDVIESLETAGAWYPIIYLAVCEKK